MSFRSVDSALESDCSTVRATFLLYTVMAITVGTSPLSWPFLGAHVITGQGCAPCVRGGFPLSTAVYTARVCMSGPQSVLPLASFVLLRLYSPA